MLYLITITNLSTEEEEQLIELQNICLLSVQFSSECGNEQVTFIY